MDNRKETKVFLSNRRISLYNPASFTRKTEAKEYGLGYEKSAFQDH